MHNPQIETKIELLTEAIEALTLASVAAVTEPTLNHKNDVLDARKILKSSLRDFLAPTLRVVQSQRHSRAGDLETTLTRTIAESSNLA